MGNQQLTQTEIDEPSMAAWGSSNERHKSVVCPAKKQNAIPKYESRPFWADASMGLIVAIVGANIFFPYVGYWAAVGLGLIFGWMSGMVLRLVRSIEAIEIRGRDFPKNRK